DRRRSRRRGLRPRPHGRASRRALRARDGGRGAACRPEVTTARRLDAPRDVAAAVPSGVRLFNRGRYLEAQQVWEAAWRDAASPDRAFLEALVQLAAGLHLRTRRGATRGAVHLLAQALVALDDYRPAAHGVDVDALDAARALFEWNYQQQLLRIQADRAEGRGWDEVSHHIFSREFLLERPLSRAITAPRTVVLLIDEVDKADPEFEAFLLEVLSDFQVSVPELGTIRARQRPVVVLTSNRTRELSEALVRRCLHLFVDF